jgi:hypothetical protein
MLMRGKIDGPHVWHTGGALLQDAQTDRPARPQRVRARGVPLGYVEGLNGARTLLAGCLSILLGRFFGFVEHEVHDHHHGAPKHDLLMPEKDFSIVKEDGSE